MRLQSDVDALTVDVLGLSIVVALHEFESLLAPCESYLLNHLLHLGDLLLFGGWSIPYFFFWVRGRKLVFEMLVEIGILLQHAKLDDVVDQVLAVHQAEELLAFNADRFQLGDDHLRGVSLGSASLVVGEDERLEEKPNPVREEHIRLRSIEYQIDQVVWIFKATLDVNAA